VQVILAGVAAGGLWFAASLVLKATRT